MHRNNYYKQIKIQLLNDEVFEHLRQNTNSSVTYTHK